MINKLQRARVAEEHYAFLDGKHYAEDDVKEHHTWRNYKLNYELGRQNYQADQVLLMNYNKGYILVYMDHHKKPCPYIRLGSFAPSIEVY